jgi:acyl carrier protein phosphodiesterase
MSLRPKEMPVKHDVKLALLEKSFSQIDENLKRIERRFDDIEKRFDKQDSKLEAIATKLDKRFEDINNRMWTNFVWLVGFGIALYGSLFAVLAHALKWF